MSAHHHLPVLAQREWIAFLDTGDSMEASAIIENLVGVGQDD